MGRPKFWTRVGLALLVSAGLAVVADSGWLVVIAPGMALLALAVTFARTRRAIATAMPTGSVASAEFLDDRLIFRNARWAREIRLDDIRAVDGHGDVVFLETSPRSRKIVIARALIPDDVFDHLGQRARRGSPRRSPQRPAE